jgi:hypothetical protein
MPLLNVNCLAPPERRSCLDLEGRLRDHSARFQQKLARKSRAAAASLHWAIFGGLEAHLAQCVACEIAARARFQSPDARDRSIHDCGEFLAEGSIAICAQTPLCFFGREPGWCAIEFLRSLEMGNLAKMRGHRFFGCPISVVQSRLFLFLFRVRLLPACRFFAGRLGETISGKWHLFDAAVNAGLFKGLERCRLRLSQSLFDSAFREDPATAARAHQQEFDTLCAHSVTNGSYLLANRSLLPRARS